MLIQIDHFSASSPTQQPLKLNMQVNFFQPKPKLDLTLPQPGGYQKDHSGKTVFTLEEKCEICAHFVITVKDSDEQTVAIILTQSSGHPLAGDGELWFFGPSLQNLWFGNLDWEQLAKVSAQAFNLLKSYQEVKNEVVEELSRVLFRVTLLDKININHLRGELVAWTQTRATREINAALNQSDTNRSHVDEKITSSSFCEGLTDNASLQEEIVCSDAQANLLSSESGTHHGLIVAANLNFIEATEWLMYLLQERGKDEAAKLKVFFLGRDIDAVARLLEKTCNQGCRFSFSFGLKNPRLLFDFLKALFDVSLELKPVEVPSSNLVVARYHDPQLTISPLVRLVGNEVFYATFSSYKRYFSQ